MALGIACLFNSGSSSSRNKEMFSIAAARCTLLGMKVRLPRQRYRRYRRLTVKQAIPAPVRMRP
jgi:hypothetical protein